jgi:acyl-CoA thioesterase-1
MIHLRAAVALPLVFLAASSCGYEPPPTYASPVDSPAVGVSSSDPRERTCCGSEPPLTYVSLGDSLAVGDGSSDPHERGYAPIYRRLLEEETGRDVRLVQLGVKGETSESFLSGTDPQLARAEAVLRENPGTIVTLSLGGNDLLRVTDGTDAEREAALARYAENLDRILKNLGSASDPEPCVSVLALYNPIPVGFTEEWVGRLNETIREVAGRNGVTVAAADEAFRGHEVEYALHFLYPWDVHPTDRGHEALARAFAEASED